MKKQKRKLLVVMHSTKKQAKTLKNALKSVYAVHGYSKLQHM